MSILSISGFDVPNCQLPGTTAQLRIYYDQTFVDSAGDQVQGGAVGSNNFFTEVSCTIANDTLSVPSFDLITSDDAQAPLFAQSPVTGVVFQNGAAKTTLFSQYVVSTSLGASCAFAAWAIFNAAVVITYPSTFYLTREQVLDLISTIPPTVADASDVVKGSTFLTVAPLVPSSPVAYGANDPAVVTLTDPQVLTNKTLTTPTIASLVNATHTHLNAAGGSVLTPAAIGVSASIAELDLLDGAGALVASGSQQPHIDDPTGGGGHQDTEARAAIVAIIDALEVFGILAP